MRIIELESLKKANPGLTETIVEFMIDCAKKCMAAAGHDPGVLFTADTNRGEQTMILTWDGSVGSPTGSDNMPQYIEYGATCISLLQMIKLTPLKIVERAMKGHGFDYWAGTQNGQLFQKHCRLEISGLLRGSREDMKSRFAAKQGQLEKKYSERIESLISIINFQTPESIFINPYQDIEEDNAGVDDLDPKEEKGPGEANAGSVEDKTITQLILKIENGKLTISGVTSAGAVIYSNGLDKIESGLLVRRRSKWTAVLNELENLINKSGVKEKELQDFFELYPDLILGKDYQRSIPQATIITDEGDHWRADFILVPYDQLTFSKILELKLPSSGTSLPSKSGHDNFYNELYKAISQIKDYHRSFDSPAVKQRFKEKYKTDVFKPDMQLIIGRRKDIKSVRGIQTLQKENQIVITDWDSLCEQLKRKHL